MENETVSHKRLQSEKVFDSLLDLTNDPVWLWYSFLKVFCECEINIMT